MSNSKKSFGRGAAILVAIGIIAKLIGALYRIPLTNIVGAEGMGLYQMVFPLYTVLLLLCGGGATNAVARVVAKYTALGDEQAVKRAVRAAFMPLVLLSVAAAVLTAVCRNAISSVQGNADAAIAYLAISPSLLFVGGIGVLRGYFQGRAQMLPSGISQLAEQIVKLSLGLYLARLLMSFGVKYAVAGALLGVTAGEFLAAAYLAAHYCHSAKKRLRTEPVAAHDAEIAAEFFIAGPVTRKVPIFGELYAFALSVTLGSLVIPITQMIDSALVINLLMGGGASRAVATARFGLLVGPVGTLVNMPTVIALSISTAFLPAVTAAIERGESATTVLESAAKWIMLFAIPITATFAVFPERICNALYGGGLTRAELSLAATLLRVQSVSVFYIASLQLFTAVLQGRNRAKTPVVNLVIGACVKVGLTVPLVCAAGILGAAAATAACYAVAAALTAKSAYKCIPTNANVIHAAVAPAALTCIGLAVFFCAGKALDRTSLGALWNTAISGCAFAAAYGLGAIILLRLSSRRKGTSE